jgi:hypothetical protein
MVARYKSYYNFVMKTEDTVLLHLQNIGAMISELPTHGTYFGRAIYGY